MRLARPQSPNSRRRHSNPSLTPWTHCALSGAPLDLDTVVSDWRGRLYNYEAVLNGLMPSDDPAEVTPASLGITSLRDVAKLKFSKNGDRLVCPISMKEIGPATRAVYLVPCGHVFAEVAITEIQESTCPECGEAFDRENSITILPTTEKAAQKLEKRIDDLRAKGLTHTLKKGKSDKKKKRKGDDLNGSAPDEKIDGKVVGDEHKRPKKDADSRISGINNPMAASLTARVLAEQDERNKRRKLASEALGRRSAVARS